MWLKRVVPFVTWGPREQAKKFASRREAVAAMQLAARSVAEALSIVAEDAANT